MPAITLKNIPKGLYQRLKRCAEENHRSLNREAILRLERSLGPGRVNPDELLARIDRVRESLSVPYLTEAFLKKAKNTGRP